MKATWSVVVVYQDAQTRDIAVGFCDTLVQRFWARCQFEAGWWSFAQIKDSALAEKAAAANLLVIAIQPDAELPLTVKAWLESWLSQRPNREGALVALAGSPGSIICHLSTLTEVYLRDIAHRGQLDFLTQVPPDLSALTPESADWCSDRARQVTSVLDEILHQPSQPPQLR